MINRTDAFENRLMVWDRKYGDCYLGYSWSWGPESGMLVEFTGDVESERGEPGFGELIARLGGDTAISNSTADHRGQCIQLSVDYMKGYRYVETLAKAQAELMFNGKN